MNVMEYHVMKRGTGWTLGVLMLALACSPQPRRADAPDSSTVAVTPTGRYLVLDADHDALVMLHPVAGGRDVLSLPGTPGRMSFRGHHAVITLPFERSVAVVDTWAWKLLRVVKVGVDPLHVAHTSDTQVAVVLAGEDAVALVDVEADTVKRKVSLGLKMPGAVTTARDHVLVTDVVEGRVARVPLDGGAAKVEALGGAADGQKATLAHGITWSGALQRAVVASSQVAVAADGRAAFVLGSGSAAPVYYGPKQAPGQGVALVPLEGAPETGPLNGNLLFTEPLSEPVAAAVVDDGRGLAVLFRGSRRVVFWGRKGGLPGTFVPCDVPATSVRVGHGADGMAITPDGDRLVVHNAADLTVTEVPVPHLVPGAACTTEGGEAQTGNTLAFADLTLPRDVAMGRRLFHDATNLDMTTVGVTCAFCHVEGLADGRTWDAPGGLRNTPTLAGAREGVTGIASTTLPLHWAGDFATFDDMTSTVVNVMVGDGIGTDQARQLAAYVDTLRKRDTGTPEDDAGRALVEEGRRIFESAETACTTCHAGQHLTDNITHALGLTDVSPMQTPVLHNLARTAPYLHDGSAPTLEALVETTVRTNRMGRGSHLSAADVTALAAYLRTL